jgi:hypothetical protein
VKEIQDFSQSEKILSFPLSWVTFFFFFDIYLFPINDCVKYEAFFFFFFFFIGVIVMVCYSASGIQEWSSRSWMEGWAVAHLWHCHCC